MLHHQTVRAWVAELDGRPIGIMGYTVQRGQPAAAMFSDMKDEMRAFPKVIVREARRLLAEMRFPAVCIASGREKGAGRFLRRLGWQYLDTSDEGDIYVWRRD